MIDFKGIRENVAIEKAAAFAGIELKKDGDKYRCFCPVCDKDRVLIITPSKSVFYCHNNKKGGDVTDLVAHVKGITQSEAAKLLQDQFMGEPEKPKRKSTTNRRKTSNTTSSKRAVQVPVQVGAQVAPVGGTEIDDWEAFIL